MSTHWIKFDYTYPFESTWDYVIYIDVDSIGSVSYESNGSTWEVALPNPVPTAKLTNIASESEALSIVKTVVAASPIRSVDWVRRVGSSGGAFYGTLVEPVAPRAVISVSGNPPSPSSSFEASVSVGNVRLFEGSGLSKSAAESGVEAAIQSVFPGSVFHTDLADLIVRDL